MRTDCIILGGGACGLAAAAALADSGLRVAVLERQDRVGKKLLATGNGRCNLSHEDMRPAHYGEAAPFVSRMYGVTPPEEVLAFWARLGLMTACEEGRIYPRTMMAASVLDVLRMGCSRDSVALLTGHEVTALTPSRRGGWSVLTANGEGFFAPAVLMAMGGSAAPHLGTDGSGTRLLARLGHGITPLYPALVQLRCAHPALRALKGLRVRAALTLLANDAPLASETGELLFADYGVSGVCVFQLSRFAAKALGEGRQVCLHINFLPELASGERDAFLSARIRAKSAAPMQELMTGALPRMLWQAVLKQAHLSPDTRTGLISAQERHALAKALFAFPLTVTGTQGFAHAQTTAGGVPLDEVDPLTMASRLFDGLYLAGEVLDVDGPCGGYNLHFAFASALTAAKSIRAQQIPDPT